MAEIQNAAALEANMAELSVEEQSKGEASLKSSASANSFRELQFQAPYGLGGPTRQTVIVALCVSRMSFAIQQNSGDMLVTAEVMPLIILNDGDSTAEDVQTSLMKKTEHKITCRRVRYETEDDDFLDVDYFDCTDNPCRYLYREMQLNPNTTLIYRQARLYYAGDIYDPGFVLECIMKEYPDAMIGLCGFSLGASQTLNYMCHRAKDYPDRLKLAVAISPPLYLDKGIIAMEKPAGKKWNNYLLSGLKTLVKPLEPVLEKKIDMAKVYAAKSMREFDTVFTAPLHGFESTEQYYSQCSAGPLLGQIERSTLVIRSGDDPFLAPEDVECPHLRTNPNITALLTSQGGHVGFIERRGVQLLPWAERVAADWCAAIFGIADEKSPGEMEL
ncbi:hypothetical protein SARC_05713 [Sphaeroforma arctica JP610]|uniref:AB hydrolase-1 domain-containing protein n=1 Tax=Sphaeroforma arctica JP610 TaxID=667725 RepID=A0A0L0FZC6_9EUKA|nr:hypothetical protein SARC_05713 [Sphaeroforma arctica JP610]KNC81984.1 hypothetical protein SARC_05713 [Sphaeroforma arctica JP610]|eukprot:XP_014155886.1 hypothetical protein SARC_05713 [Sphaeroforma arctica JP610]